AGGVIRTTSFQPDLTITQFGFGCVAQHGVVLPRGVPPVVPDVPVPDRYLSRLERNTEPGLHELRRFLGSVASGDITCNAQDTHDLAVRSAYRRFDGLKQSAVAVPRESEPFLVGAWPVSLHGLSIVLTERVRHSR